jgi:hypothetical protein
VQSHERAGSFHPCFRSESPPGPARRHQGRVKKEGSELLTTNLDNDDSLAADFVARVQAAAPLGERTAVYLGNGLICRDAALYRRFDRHNAFCSVRKPWEGAVGCWTDWHNLLPDQMPAVVLRGAPGWQQVVHGANVSNRVRGRRTQPSRHRTPSGLLDDLPGGGAAAGDGAAGVPARPGVGRRRACAKVVLGAVAGKAGLDRAKAIWTSARLVTR